MGDGRSLRGSCKRVRGIKKELLREQRNSSMSNIKGSAITRYNDREVLYHVYYSTQQAITQELEKIIHEKSIDA